MLRPAGLITVALVGARVIDGTGAAPIANATILVSNGRIERIGPAASLKVPAGAMRVDLAGKIVIPGLINAHGHLGNGDRALPVYDQIIQQLKVYPRFGVTTVYALGDDGVESVRVSMRTPRLRSIARGCLRPGAERPQKLLRMRAGLLPTAMRSAFMSSRPA